MTNGEQPMKFSKRWGLLTPALALVFLTGACAPKAYLKVQYQLPSPSSTLQGQQVALVVADERDKQVFLTESAEKALKNHDGTFSLVVVHEDGSGNLIGAYDLTALLTEVFRQRLNNAGIQVAALGETAGYELRIDVEEFKLDFVDRKWIVSMNYRASLLNNGSLLAGESVSGQAERLKVMGRSDAEKVLSELLSDTVNKLNLVNLFRQVRK
jgi:uncharacterized lipoprotein YajG